ncbi:MAG: hypothetical protein K0R00_55 [Herbinix sp.]|jgi:hypothetical protein|nr:hypothetical protein [Herbinix sp.]
MRQISKKTMAKLDIVSGVIEVTVGVLGMVTLGKSPKSLIAAASLVFGAANVCFGIDEAVEAAQE